LVLKDAAETPEWEALQKALHDFGVSHFGAEYPAMAKAGQVRSPIRTEVCGKGWPSNTVAFMNLKSGHDYPPTVVTYGPHGGLVKITDPSLIYPGAIVRASLRIYGYGGKGSPFGPGISFGLNNVLKVEDGPRLKTGQPDGSEFGGGVGAELAEMLR
jgi:Enterobacter phage Enc34, ssDNA-binding protein